MSSLGNKRRHVLSLMIMIYFGVYFACGWHCLQNYASVYTFFFLFLFKKVILFEKNKNNNEAKPQVDNFNYYLKRIHSLCETNIQLKCC